MKLGTETHEIETFGVNNQTAFSIEAHSISFRILSDQLYSDKILAVVRELSCNAYDSHVDAGKKDIPFLVHMPNTLEPWFAVRDWGIGLSDDGVKHLYTTYFGSTKRGSNDSVGCLGLGSKSPFAYTDSFTVTSWFNGMKRTYTAFIGEEGIPMISQMGEETTDEDNGLEVSLSVKQNDFGEFIEKSKTALCRFNPAPKIIGNKNFNLDSIEYWMKGNGWALRKEDHKVYYNRKSAMAIQGSVAYPIDRDSMKELTSNQKKLLDLPIDIYFDLGELGITPSRESLSYSDGTKGTINTISNILKHVDAVFDELPSKFESEFDSCKTYWEACVLFSGLFNDASRTSRVLMSLADSPAFNIQWNNKALKSHFKCKPELMSKTFRIIKFDCNYNSGRAKPLVSGYDGNWKFRASNATKFFFDDVGRGAHSRIREWFLNIQQKDTVKTVYLIKTDVRTDLDLFIGLLGDVKVTAVSTLPKPPRQNKTNDSRQSVQCDVWVWNKKGNGKENWETSKHKLRDGGVYVTLRRFKVLLNTSNAEIDLKHQYMLYRDAGFINDSISIYGLQPRNAKAVADNPKWITLEDYTRKMLQNMLKNDTLINKIANAKHYSDFTLTGQFECNKSKLFLESDTWDDLADTSAFKQFLNAHIYMSKHDASSSAIIIHTANMLNVAVPEGKVAYDLDALWNNIIVTYPMLEFLVLDSNYYSRFGNITWNDTQIKSLIQYIKGIDEAV